MAAPAQIAPASGSDLALLASLCLSSSVQVQRASTRPGQGAVDFAAGPDGSRSGPPTPSQESLMADALAAKVLIRGWWTTNSWRHRFTIKVLGMPHWLGVGLRRRLILWAGRSGYF